MNVLRVNPARCTARELLPASRWLAMGGLVVFPTDTLYGLACDVRLASAIDAVFDAKGRNASSALPLIAASVEQVELATGPLTPTERRVVDHAWPGPLSIIRDAPAWVPAALHGGTGTVAIRVPDHGVSRCLAESLGWVIAATSANRSGAAPADRVDALDAITDDARVLVVDGGATPGGPPSTIVDLRGEPRCVREGAVPWSRVLDWLHA